MEYKMVYERPQVKTIGENAQGNQIDAGVFVNIGVIGLSGGGLSQSSKVIVRGNSGDLTDFVDAKLTDASVYYKGFAYTKNVDYEVKPTTGELEWKSTVIPAPYIKSATPSTIAGGSLAAGTYYYVVTAFKAITATPTYGETVKSNEVNAQLASTGKITLSWSKNESCDGYRIYRGTTTGGETLIRELSGSDKTSWDDTGIYTPGVTTPPTTNTATKRPPYSIADTAGYWTGGNASANLAALAAVGNGSLTLAMDGRDTIQITGIVLTGVATLAAAATILQTAMRSQYGDEGYYQGADCNTNFVNIKAVTNGRLRVNINGAGLTETADIDFSSANDMSEIATLLQTAIQTATSTTATVTYDATNGLFKVYSHTRGSASSVAIAAPTTSGKTNLILSQYFNFTNGTAIAGVNYNLTVTYEAVPTAFVVTSPITGTSSRVTVTEGVAGTPIGGASLTALTAAAGGVETAGTVGNKTSYDVIATISGQNYFNPQTFYSVSDVATAHGSTSDLYAYAQKMLLPPARGQGCKVLTIVGVNDMTRGAVQAALEELGKVDVDEAVLLTTNVDMLRDLANHCIYWSRDDNKKERIPILSLDPAEGTTDFVNFAAEFAGEGDRVAVVFDNYTTEPNVAPLVAALQASLPDRASSMIGTALQTSLPTLNAGRVNANGETYLLGAGVMVLSKDDQGILTIIDDRMCNGSDLPGRLVEDYMRKTIRQRLNPMKGKNKMVPRTKTGVEEIAASMLDSFVYQELIASYDRNSLVAENASDNPEKIILRFKYVRMRTLKVIEVRYTVLDA